MKRATTACSVLGVGIARQRLRPHLARGLVPAGRPQRLAPVCRDVRIVADVICALERRHRAGRIAAAEAHPAHAVEHCRIVRHLLQGAADQRLGAGQVHVMISQGVAEGIHQRGIIGPHGEQALQRLYRFIHVPGLLQDDRTLVLERRVLRMRPQPDTQQFQRRIGTAVVAQKLRLRDGQIDALLGMLPRVLPEERERVGRVMRAEEQRRGLLPRLERQRANPPACRNRRAPRRHRPAAPRCPTGTSACCRPPHRSRPGRRSVAAPPAMSPDSYASTARRRSTSPRGASAVRSRSSS